MRYLGSKEQLVKQIGSLLISKGLNNNPDLTFFDAFCGMGAVADAFKDLYNIVINDSLLCAVTFTNSRLLSSICKFENLGFNPIVYFNESKDKREGFFYKNYSPGGSERMYFTSENAARIDYFRWQIEEWKNEEIISQNEYIYLLGCLLESVSSVSNTAGVYGAFLKHWDSRALKAIKFLATPASIAEPLNIMRFNDKIENIIEDIDCDILYLDPPYTQNQYGTQYHLLETLILNDQPILSRITGSRPTTPLRSDWSKMYHCHILFEKVIAKTKAKYIIMSYNNDGFMSKDYIDSILKRYGVEETYECQIINYKKYNNTKCQGKEGHVEYLFYIEKKNEEDIVIESPLNYQGNKSKMIATIKGLMPNNISTFIDAFGGGFNVGINMNAKQIIYNDINHYVHGLVNSFGTTDTFTYLSYINKIIKKYDLSTENKESYLKLRSDYNALLPENRDPKLLYSMLLYGFQQQIRFNTAHEFNNPFGTRYFNDRLLAKFISYSRTAHEKDIVYTTGDYRQLDYYLNNDSFIYFDPPYRDAAGAYNDGKRGFEGWSKKLESELFDYLDSINKRNFRFMLSYNVNDDIIRWANQNNYHIINLEETQGRYNRRMEVIILNY